MLTTQYGGEQASTRVVTAWGKRAEVPGCLVKSRDNNKCQLSDGARCLTNLRQPSAAGRLPPRAGRREQAHGGGSAWWPPPDTEAGLAEGSSAGGSPEARMIRRLRP